MTALGLALTAPLLTLWRSRYPVPTPPAGQLLLVDTAADAALLMDDFGAILTDFS